MVKDDTHYPNRMWLGDIDTCGTFDDGCDGFIGFYVEREADGGIRLGYDSIDSYMSDSTLLSHADVVALIFTLS